MQKNAQPIREAVVNLNSHHTKDDLIQLTKDIKASHGLDVFQVHIHVDEGKSRLELNYHAHLLIDIQDKEKGTMRRFTRSDLSKLQTTVSESLGMERGELKENTNRERLEVVEYKREQEQKQLNNLKIKNQILQEQNASLEQKKNELIRRHREASENATSENAEIEYIGAIAEGGETAIRGVIEDQVPTIFRGIKFQREEIKKLNTDTLQILKRINAIGDESKRIEQAIRRG